MPKRESRWSTRSTVLFAVFVALLGVAAGLLWTWPRAAPMSTPGERGAALHEPILLPAPAAEPRPTPPDDIERVAVQPAPPASAPPPPLDFAAAITELCAKATRASELARDDEIEAARETDQQVRALFGRLLDTFPDAGERSLAMLLEFPDPATTPDAPPVVDHARRTVLQMVLGVDLDRRHRLAQEVDDFTRSDRLVQVLLESLPTHSIAADVGTSTLAGKPYLRLTHEPAVLDLVRLAGEGRFSREFATRLLTTLWDNLQRTGERSSDETSMLALLYLDDRDRSQAVTACRQLLADARYRDLVYSRLRERGDRELATDVARLAAHEMEPQQALRALRELHPLLEHAGGLYLGVGVRAPEAVADAYREHLAHDQRADVRRDLVMGLGMQPNGRGLEIAELAMQSDPDPEVRIQALFALSIHAEPARAERAFGQLLDDPAIARDPDRLAQIVVALQNLEHGDVNIVARLGRRMQTMAVADYGAGLLAQILERCLPGGSSTEQGVAGG